MSADEHSMKIAIAKEGNQVCPHFGHCEGWVVYRVKNAMIIREGELDNPGHEPGRLPAFLHEHGISLVIAGGMGPRAIELFCNLGIKVVVGIKGNIERIAQDYIAGRLEPGESACHH